MSTLRAMAQRTAKRTYLVTGAAGFIGARFVESCNERGIETISVDRENYFQSRSEHQGISFGTIVDRDRLLGHISKTGTDASALPLAFDAVIHLGACTNTMELNEAFLTRVNLEYSKALWNYCTEKHIPFVYASSAATYGDGSSGYDDDEELIPRLRPLNPYGESKRLFDLWALAEEQAGRKPPSWSGFKFFNVYGFGERHKNKMASVVLHAYDQIRATGRVRLFKSHREGIADGHQKRDFVFVEDAVRVLHFALEHPIPRGIFNLGTGHARTYLDLARAVFAALELPERIDFIDTPVEIRDRYQYFTEAKMERLRSQGYERPFTRLEDGVQKYIARLTGQQGKTGPLT